MCSEEKTSGDDYHDGAGPRPSHDFRCYVYVVAVTVVAISVVVVSINGPGVVVIATATTATTARACPIPHTTIATATAAAGVTAATTVVDAMESQCLTDDVFVNLCECCVYDFCDAASRELSQNVRKIN